MHSQSTFIGAGVCSAPFVRYYVYYKLYVSDRIVFDAWIIRTMLRLKIWDSYQSNQINRKSPQVVNCWRWFTLFFTRILSKDFYVSSYCAWLKCPTRNKKMYDNNITKCILPGIRIYFAVFLVIIASRWHIEYSET